MGTSPQVLPFDTTHSRVGFRLHTRWGQHLRGEFPAYEGEVRVYPDGRRDVRMRLDSTRMHIVGHGRYSRWAKGPDFFDVADFPVIRFVSETYDATLLREGGALHGTLTMRDISRPVRFILEPATCEQPGIACDVVASGEVDRTDFGMDDWQVAVGDTVRFELRVRTAEAAVTP
ncbi:MAG TPA: YceI family protein [Xanthomonadaceae bacterium]|nr:YceI family protein [Xanthomonadaceae bacterium]